MKESSMVFVRLKTSSSHWNNKCCFLRVWWDTSRRQTKSVPSRSITSTEVLVDNVNKAMMGLIYEQETVFLGDFKET
ncbi:hypothetical protein LguiB_022269 [Lonicera macranthoides]